MAGGLDATDRERWLSERERGAPARMLDPADLLRLRDMPAARRERVARRLAVIEAWRSPADRGRFRDAIDAGGLLGLSRSGFFKLLKGLPDGGATPIAALGVYVDDVAGSARGRERDVDLRRIAADVLDASPGVSDREAVRRMRERAGKGASDYALRRAVESARPTMSPTGRFGEMLVFDAASLDLLDERGRRQRLYALLDRGTGVVAGWTVLPEDMFEEGYLTAQERALSSELLARMADPAATAVAAGREVVVEARIPRGVDSYFRTAIVGRGWNSVAEPRFVGRALIETLGRYVAGVPMAAGRASPDVVHRSGRPARLPVASPLVLAEIDAAVTAHDSARADLVPGSLGGARAALAAALSPKLG